MTDVAHVVETNRERISRRQVDKFAERRAQLADAALQTLAELGYARTSLREIAQNSQFSHGVLHYYFSDKQDLLTHCVRQYEAACVTRYDEIVATASSAEELKREFSAAMAQTLRTDAPMHRLWYDLRNQSLFEESFRADVLEIDQRREEMIWRVISRYAEFAGITVALSPGVAYAMLDGLFQQALLHQLAGNQDAAGVLAANVMLVLDTLGGRQVRVLPTARRLSCVNLCGLAVIPGYRRLPLRPEPVLRWRRAKRGGCWLGCSRGGGAVSEEARSHRMTPRNWAGCFRRYARSLFGYACVLTRGDGPGRGSGPGRLRGGCPGLAAGTARPGRGAARRLAAPDAGQHGGQQLPP